MWRVPCRRWKAGAELGERYCRERFAQCVGEEGGEFCRARAWGEGDWRRRRGRRGEWAVSRHFEAEEVVKECSS